MCVTTSVVNCWDLVVSITGHTDCTFSACIGGGGFMEGEQSVVLAERNTHEAGWPGIGSVSKTGWFSPRCVDVLG